MGGVVYEMVACGPAVRRSVVLLDLEVGVAGSRGGVAVETVACRVSSSVISDLSVTVTGAVVSRTSVTSTGVSVIWEWSCSDVLLLTVGGAVVRPKPTLSSSVWDETPCVPSWIRVLELWVPVEDSVDVPKYEPSPWSVPEMLVGSTAGEMTGGVDETDTSVWSAPGSVTMTDGVELEVPSDVTICWCWVAFSGPIKVLLETPGLPVSETVPSKDWSVLSVPSVLGDEAVKV